MKRLNPFTAAGRHRQTKVIMLIVAFAVVFASGYVISNSGHFYDRAADRPGNWQLIRPPHENQAFVEQGRLLWAGGADGVVGIDRKTGLISTKLAHDPSFRYVKALLVDPAGRLWVGHENGLSCNDRGVWKEYTVNDGLPDNMIQALAQDRQGLIWAGTKKGVAVLSPAGIRVFTAKDGLLDDMVNVILADDQGAMWFGSYTAPRGGISVYQAGRWAYFTTAGGLPHNNITCLYQDRDGVVWAGVGLMDRGGVVQFQITAQAVLIKQATTRETGLGGSKVRSILQDRQGTLWLGFEEEGLTAFADGSGRNYTVKNGLPDNAVRVMLQDRDGDIWLGTADGIVRIRQ